MFSMTKSNELDELQMQIVVYHVERYQMLY